MLNEITLRELEGSGAQFPRVIRDGRDFEFCTLPAEVPVVFSDLNILPDCRAVSSGELLSHVLSVAQEYRSGTYHSVLVADLDGTLWANDVAHRVIEYALRSRALDLSVYPLVIDYMDRFSLKPSRHFSPIERLHADIETLSTHWERLIRQPGLSPTVRFRETIDLYQMNSWVFGGLTESDVRMLALEALAEGQLSSTVCSELTNFIAAARDEGIRPVVVSASLEILVEVMGPLLGVDSRDCLGMQVRIDDRGRLTTRVTQPLTFAAGKTARVTKHILGSEVSAAEKAPFLVALGDAPASTDAGILSSALVPIVVNPSTAMHIRAAAELAHRNEHTRQLVVNWSGRHSSASKARGGLQ